MNYYNLEMIVAIGFRVRSNTGTDFRKWANERLTEYMTKGFTMNDDILKHAIEESIMTMEDWIKELDYFLKMNRKDILNGSGKVSHEDAMNYAKKEYKKYKNRISLAPSDIEIHYLESLKDLEKIENKK